MRYRGNAKLKVESEDQARLVLETLQRIRQKPKLTLVDDNFPEQAAFVRSNATLGAALCTRRAGKSYAVGLKLFKKCFDYPGATVLYLALTRDSAKRIMWKDVLKDIIKKKNIPCKLNETELTVTLLNGSVIKLAGADADEKEKEKFLGGKYAYVAIDEAGSFSTDLEQLVYEYLEPAVADYDGSIDLIGTPTIFWKGFFCKVTEGRENGWTIFKWNTTQNPYMQHWPKRLRLLKERNPRIEETPGYRRMYLGEWVKDDEALVYKFNRLLNLTDTLPEKSLLDGQVLGVDLGFTDATAYSLAQYYRHDPCLYFVHTYKKEGQIVDKVVEKIKWYHKKKGVRMVVIDNASKQVVETIKARFSLYDIVIEAAEKTDKFAFIEIMNSDFRMERIKLLRNETEDLVEEYENLIKDPKSEKPAEHPDCDNHLCDASLYAWRKARNYMARPAPDEVSLEDQIEKELEDALEKELKENDNPFAMEYELNEI